MTSVLDSGECHCCSDFVGTGKLLDMMCIKLYIYNNLNNTARNESRKDERRYSYQILGQDDVSMLISDASSVFQIDLWILDFLNRIYRVQLQ